ISVGRKPAITSSSKISFGSVASARQFHPLAVRQCKRRGCLCALVVKFKPTQQIMRTFSRFIHAVTMQQRADDDVFFHGNGRTRAHNLERASNAAATYLVGGEAFDAFTG